MEKNTKTSNEELDSSFDNSKSEAENTEKITSFKTEIERIIHLINYTYKK